MSPEERQLLEKSVELAEDNNKMLHSMRRSMRFARVMSILYWVLIIGISLGTFYFIQPYIDQLKGVYGNATSVLDGLKGN